MSKAVPENLFEELCKAAPTKNGETRAQSAVIEQRVAALVPSLIGGAADLNPSTKTYLDGFPAISADHFEGRNIHFGIRENAMGSFVNGVALSDGFIPFGSTFLVFSDYMVLRFAWQRISGFMRLHLHTTASTWVRTAPPISPSNTTGHFASSEPGLGSSVRRARMRHGLDARPYAARRAHGLCAFTETVANIPRPEGFDNRAMLRGSVRAVRLGFADARARGVGLGGRGRYGGQEILEAAGERVRVVSVPCLSLFERQDVAYRAAVLPPGVRRVVIEVGVTGPWRGLAGDAGQVIGRDDFGRSAPDKVLQRELGFTKEAVAARIRGGV